MSLRLQRALHCSQALAHFEALILLLWLLEAVRVRGASVSVTLCQSLGTQHKLVINSFVD